MQAPSDLKNPLELSKGVITAVTSEFAPLRELNLSTKVIRYVIDGDEPSILLEVAGQKDALDAMGLYSPSSSSTNWSKMLGASGNRGKLLVSVATSGPVLLQRIGEVYAAIRQPHGGVGLGQILPNVPNWLAELLKELIITHQRGKLQAWPLTIIEQLLAHASLEASLLIGPAMDSDFTSQVASIAGYSSSGWTHAFEGWGDYFVRHRDVVRSVLQTKTTSEQRMFALETLRLANVAAANQMQEKLIEKQRAAVLTGLIDLLVPMACDSSKVVREGVQHMLRQPIETDAELRTEVRTQAERILRDGDAAQRTEAAVLLWRLFGPDAKDCLAEQAAKESAARVKQTIERLISAPDASTVESSSTVFLADLPPVNIPTGKIPLPDAAKDELRKYVQKKYDEAEKQFKAELARHEAQDPKPAWKPQPPPKVDEKELKALFEFVEGNSTKQPGNSMNRYLWTLPLLDSWKPPAVQLIQIVRLMMATQVMNIHPHVNSLWTNSCEILESHRKCSQPPYGLRELDFAVASMPNGKPGMAATAYLAGNNNYHSQFDWEPEAVWPVFVERPQQLHQALGPSPNRGRNYNSYDWQFSDKRRNAFRVLAMLPSLPSEYVPPLWDMALGDTKADRIPAQNALVTIEGKTEKILLALQDGRQETRAAAADWLGRLKDPAAIEPLKTAFRKEKQEFVKGIYMGALESLGASVDEFLDRKKLLKEAEAGLAKKRPKGMDWFPVAAMPAIHWADTGKPVDPKILHWWVVQTVQQKSPTCGPLLRRYLEMCRPNDAAILGKFVLSAWISEDTRQVSQEEAAARAGKDADQQWNQYGSQTWWKEYYKDRDNLYRQLFQQYSEQFLGSAIGEKGMLALASVAGDSDCVKLCEQYLRKFFGHRLAQCKALIEVLAWMKHPLAIQLLLSIGNRFRTKALRQAANDHVQALAEREGWTIDELADRTIPDAGFARPTDEEGRPTGTVAELILDYGPRSFVVRLDDELEPVITREDGKAVKAPPAPAKSDDEEKAKAAKKAFTEAKKLVKEVVKRQSERMYEAVCTQRCWRFDDWQRYLAQHPIVGKICTRVVWSAFEPSGSSEKFLTNFRPLEDGSLTNEQDDSVTLKEDTLIRVAHDCNTPAQARPLWIQHLQDYDVTPVFQQFGRTVFELPSDKGDTNEINDFEGHLITTFKLRGKATKLGWLRGEAEDGGCFMLYRKPFPSLELQAVLEFTGSFLPEDDIPAALKGLSFEAIRNNREETSSWSRSAMPLKKIPPVLLSECYNDIRQIAAEGTGFDPEWEKKSYF